MELLLSIHEMIWKQMQEVRIEKIYLAVNIACHLQKTQDYKHIRRFRFDTSMTHVDRIGRGPVSNYWLFQLQAIWLLILHDVS